MLDIIIVNWNSGSQLRACLESIINAKYRELTIDRVLVVDNASVDDSADNLNVPGLPLVIVKNQENLGFGAACNQGASGSRAEFLLFLNPDTLLFDTSLKKTIAFMKNPLNSSVGILGIQLVNEKHEVSKTCARFPSPGRFFAKTLGLNRIFPNTFSSHFMQEWDHNSTRQVDQVMGAFFLVRRSLFESLGGFDQRFFVYFEEVDFSLRALQVGWKSYFLAEAQAYHKGGGITEQVKGLRLFYSLRSRILYGYKHFSWPAATILMAWTILIEPLAHLSAAVLQGSFHDIREVLKGTVKLWGAIPWFFEAAGNTLLRRFKA